MSKKSCYICDKVLVKPDLTEVDSDSLCVGIGICVPDYRMLISPWTSSGFCLEVHNFNSTLDEWIPVGYCFPKYCPNCGRRLF